MSPSLSATGRAMPEREAFAGLSLVHELSQPLAGILLNAEAALTMCTREPVRTAHGEPLGALLSDIVCEAVRCRELLAGLRSLFVEEPPCVTPVDLGALLPRVAVLAGRARARTTVTPDVRLPADSIRVSAHRVLIEQLFLNLLTNALDAVQDLPGATVRVAARMAGAHAAVLVEDTGPGFAEHVRPSTGTVRCSTKRDGLGIGLSLSRRIVALHGGAMRIESIRPGGTCVTVTLPLAAA